MVRGNCAAGSQAGFDRHSGYDSAKEDSSIAATSTGTDTEQKATISFPANTTGADAVYTIANDADAQTVTVTIAKASSGGSFDDMAGETYYAHAVAWAAHAEWVRSTPGLRRRDRVFGPHPRVQPQELMDHKELFYRLWNAINSLPEVQGGRVDAYLTLGKSYRQITREEGVDKNAVRRSVRTGIESMKKHSRENF